MISCKTENKEQDTSIISVVYEIKHDYIIEFFLEDLEVLPSKENKAYLNMLELSGKTGLNYRCIG